MLSNRPYLLAAQVLVDTGRVLDSYENKKGSPAPDADLIKAFIR
jgi:hypothetical protein